MSSLLFFDKPVLRIDHTMIFSWFRFGNFLAITPFKISPNSSKILEIYPILFSVLYCLLAIYTVHVKYHIYSNLPCLGKCSIYDKAGLDGAEFVTEFLLVQQVVYRCYFGRKNWENLLNTVVNLEKEFSKNYDYFENDLKIWKMRTDLILFHMLFFAVHIFDNWANWGDVSSLTAYLIYRISTYYVLYTMLFIMFLSKWLKNRYIFLNNFLQNVVNKNKQQLAQVNQSETNNLQRKLKKFEHWFRELHVICQECNTVFGWTQFFLMVVTVVGILSGCNYGLPTRKEVKEPKVIAINIIFPMIYVVSVFGIVLSFDKVEKIGQKIPKTCFLLYELSKDTQVKDVLYNLSSYTNGLGPKFSAAGFWTVNRHVLSALFTSILTYLIIIIQSHMTVD